MSSDSGRRSRRAAWLGRLVGSAGHLGRERANGQARTPVAALARSRRMLAASGEAGAWRACGLGLAGRAGEASFGPERVGVQAGAAGLGHGMEGRPGLPAGRLG